MTKLSGPYKAILYLRYAVGFVTALIVVIPMAIGQGIYAGIIAAWETLTLEG